MSYIVLLDTFGDGLEVPDLTSQPEVLSRSDLDPYVSGLVLERIEEFEEGLNLACESIVICKILDKIDGENVKDYAKRVYSTLNSEAKEERHALYLKLKEEFEP